MEGIAVLAGYDEAGGGKAICRSIIPMRSKRWAQLSSSFRASWLPKVTNGCSSGPRASFRRQYLDEVSSPMRISCPIRTRGIQRFFEERCRARASTSSTKPESALSPARQMEFLKLMRRMDQSAIARSSWPRIRRC